MTEQAAPARRTTPGDKRGAPLSIAATNMALGTLVSRITGVVRLATLAYALGVGAAADAYNLANTTPNIVHDLVLGGVVGATFVPVFVDHLARHPADDNATGRRAISAVVTLSFVVLAVATVLFEIAAPTIIRLYTISNHAPSVGAERVLGTDLLRLFVPQLAFYGAISLFTALLNARRHFTAPAYAPIVNNIVSVAVYLGFASLLRHPSVEHLHSDMGAILLLGIGTTLGVAFQCAALVPALRRNSLHLRWTWEPGHPAVRTIARLSSWTFGFVVANQITAFIILALAAGLHPGSVSAYTYAFTFFQLPYGVIAVSVMSAVTPEMATRWLAGDGEGYAHYFSRGLRSLLAVIVPASIGMLILAQPLIRLFLAHGAAGPNDAGATGSTLAMLAIGLPGFSVYLYAVRGFQAMQDTRTVFVLYLVENGINLVLAFAFAKPLGVEGIALSLSVAYSVAALVALRVLRRRTHARAAAGTALPFVHVVLASGVMAGAVLATRAIVGFHSGLGLLWAIACEVAVGIVSFGVGSVALAAFSSARRRTRHRLYGPPLRTIHPPTSQRASTDQRPPPRPRHPPRLGPSRPSRPSRPARPPRSPGGPD